MVLSWALADELHRQATEGLKVIDRARGIKHRPPFAGQELDYKNGDGKNFYHATHPQEPERIVRIPFSRADII